MFTRYAVYFTATGLLAQTGAAWLGYDIESGERISQPEISGLDLQALTETPRKYGFHGTLKPPFALRPGLSADQLHQSVAALGQTLAPVAPGPLGVSRMGRFLALTVADEDGELNRLAAKVVRDLDIFRAPMGAAEFDRRRKPSLTPAQVKNLRDWGYPFVMQSFRFHMTLTGRLGQADAMLPIVARHFEPALTQPFRIDALTLAGERADGFFEQIARIDLQASSARASWASPE